MDKENSDSISLSPPVKRIRKKWKYNPAEPIPRSTIYRWQRFKRLNDERDNTTEPLASISNVADCDSCSLSSVSDGSESSDCSIANEDNMSDGTSTGAICDVSELSDFDDVISNAIEDNDDENTSTYSLEPGSISSISSLVDMLYSNGDISVTQAVLMILNFYVRHKLSKAALQELLMIVHKILPKDNTFPKTLHHFFKFVKDAASSCNIFKHYYCNECLYYYGTNADIQSCTSCSSKKGPSYFFEMDLVHLIKDMFERRNLASKLRPSEHQENIISDITDGSEYIRINSRPDRNEFDLTLMLNTDGISLVKSSKSHCWPLMFMITELPEYLRESFIGVLGLWYDKNQKPCMNTFLQPFCEKLNKCFHEGIKWTHPSTQKIHISKVVAPLFIADAPARAEIQNVSYFNGKYGCNLCEMKTKRCKKEKDQKKTVRAYIFTEEDKKLRSCNRMEQQAQFALLNNLPNKRGVKGRSIVSDIPMLDLATCVLPEYMHSVLLGVGKQFVNLWLKKKENWNVSKDIEKIDELLLNICPPLFFNRMPRSLKDLSYYKASEFYNLILFYSIPIFNTYLPDVYMQHWILFVLAIFNLLKKPIRIHPELEQTEILLRLFVRDIQELYGNTQYTYNVHQLLHLTLCVKRWGPVWSTSAFPFENVNGVLSTCIHGSKHLGQEMVNNLQIIRGWQNLKATAESDRDISGCSDFRELQMLDKINISKLYDDKLIAFIQSLSTDTEDIHCFLRCRMGNNNYTSVNYKTIKTNSYTIEIKANDRIMYEAIQIFININSELGFILKPFNIETDQMFCHRETETVVSHILPITEKSEYLYFKIRDVKCMFHVIRISNYVCKRPNHLNKVM